MDSEEATEDAHVICAACKESITARLKEEVNQGILIDWTGEQLKRMRDTASESIEGHVIEREVLVESRMTTRQTEIALSHVAREHQEADLFKYGRMFAIVPSELEWAFWAAILGQPLDSLRTLRYAFELLVQTHVLEKKYSLLKDDEKFVAQHRNMLANDEVHRSFYLELVDDMGGFDANGRPQGFDVEERETLKGIYRRLSKYTHPSYEQVVNPPDLKLVTSLMLRLVDLMVAVAIDLFPSIAGEISKELPVPLQVMSMSSKRIRHALGSIPSSSSTTDWDIRYIPSGVSGDSK